MAVNEEQLARYVAKVGTAMEAAMRWAFFSGYNTGYVDGQTSVTVEDQEDEE